MKYRIPQLTNTRCSDNADDNSEVVLALHCSGGSAKQWRGLTQTLGQGYDVQTPEYFGSSPEKLWCPNKMLTLADEAQASIQIIDQTDKNIHLVGHSYGGALALHIALARPERISSISLYEPCAFHILPKLGVFAATEMAEIATLAAEINRYAFKGDNRSAMQIFVDYWNGEGAWSALKPDYQESLMRWAPNATNAFDALFAEEVLLADFRKLKVPVQLLQGCRSPDPVHVVSAALLRMLPESKICRLPGVGHMGPITHAEEIAQLIAEHIETHTHSVTVRPTPQERAIEFAAVAA